MHPQSDRNLLFGVLAVQMNFVNRDDFAAGNPQEMALPGFVEALGRWAVPHDKDWFAYTMNKPEAQNVLGNDPTFARELAALGEVFVNDAFGTAHRAHASTVGVTAYLPSVAGLLMAREIATLGRIMTDPPLPLVAVIGGSKISTKIGVLKSLLERVDRLCVGGAMACTFLKAKGLDMGRSLVEEDQLDTARSLLAAPARGRTLILPLDAVVAADAKPGVPAKTVSVDAVPPELKVLDVGPMTVERFLQVCDGAGAVVWNGPLGVYEVPPFNRGTQALAEGLAGSQAETIIGGGDLVAAVQELHLADRMSFVSTGGGATLEFLEGKTLPGIAALRDA